MKHKPRPPAPEPGPQQPADTPAIPLVIRVLMTAMGAVLIFLAQVSNFSENYLFASAGRVFVHPPWAQPHEYTFFPVWLVLVCLPAALVLLGLCFRPFRQALRAPWRDAKLAVPFALALAFLIISLAPWEPGNLKPQDTGSWMVFIVVTGSCGFALVMAGLYRQLRFLDAALRSFYDWLMALPRWSFIALTAGTMFLLANAVSWGIFEHIPHIQDSVSQVFQARIFASGRLFLPSPAFPDFFDYTHIINIGASTGHPASGFNIPNWPGPEGRWYSQYTFMHSLLLMLGVFIRAPWVINPLLGALFVAAVYFLGREVYDERTGRLSAALAAITPFVFDMSGEYMNHSSALLFVTLFLLFFFRTVREGKWRQVLAAGFFWGCAANVRGYTAMAVAAPFAVWGLILLFRQPGRFIPRFLTLLVVAAAVTSLSLVYNYLTNGHPMLFGYVVKWGAGHEVGFGRSGWGDFHTPMRGLLNTGHDLTLLNKFLFEWPLPSLLPLVILFAAGTKDKRDWLLVSVYLALVTAFFFYWFHNVCFGPRFLYESSAALIILTVRGGMALPRLVRNTFGLEASEESVHRFISRAVPVLLLVFVAGAPALVRCYKFYGWVDGRIQRNVRRQHLENALVFATQFGSGYSSNRLDLQGNVVYAHNYGMLNSALTIAYPNRNYYYANQDTLRPLPDIAWPGSRLQRALWEMAYAVPDTALDRYKTFFWPFRDIQPPRLDSALLATRLVDYREASREIFSGRRTLDDYMPALACWVLNDDREHLAIFSYMDDIESFVASDFKFTLLYVTSDGTAAIYDVRRMSGDEEIVPDRTGALPMR